MAEPYEEARFQNAVTYTVAITYTVEGGARFGTADRRARRMAERLANSAARIAGVVDVVAQAGPTGHDGELRSAQRVRFSAANSGTGSYGEPDKLDRYLDPEHELALRSLAAFNDAYRQRQSADRQRRLDAGCRNPYQSPSGDWCRCVYCDPETHYRTVELIDSGFAEHRCVCGQPVADARDRCVRHRASRIVALDNDPAVLQLLARHDAEQTS